MLSLKPSFRLKFGQEKLTIVEHVSKKSSPFLFFKTKYKV